VKLSGAVPLVLIALISTAYQAHAQEDEKFTFNGYIQMQGGVFVPLTSDLFQETHNRAVFNSGKNEGLPCNPDHYPTMCSPSDHGDRMGKASMMRSTAQLMAEYRPEERVTLHAVLRLAGSLSLEVDSFAQPPTLMRAEDREHWIWDNYYNEFDLREFYLDIEATDWLSFRLGRQQVSWGDLGAYRLLDVINPTNETWHLGPLESFEDMRIPLWMAKVLFEIKEIDHSLEIVWIPGVDRDRDTVSVPLTLVGAWGLPLSSTPSSFIFDEKKFMYPGRAIDDQRAGLRWRGNITPASTYTLVYYYTHQLSPPVPVHLDVDLNLLTGEGDYIYESGNTHGILYLDFPRQHIAGFTVDYAIDNPVGMVVKLEAAFEPDRTYPRSSDSEVFDDPDMFDYSPFFINGEEKDPLRYRIPLHPEKRFTASYAIQLMRPTMIRFLNPTQNFLLVGQFMHTMVPTLSDKDTKELINIPGYNDWKVARHTFTGVLVIGTNYLHGLLAPRVTAAYVHPESGFISTSLDVRLGRNWRLRLQINDFFGADPYKGLGLFRDRDEINLLVRAQF